MAPPSPPGKRRRITLLEWIIVIGGFTAIIGYNRINLARLQRSLPNVNSKIVGVWKAERGPEHLLFRTDESVSMTVPGSAAGDNAAEAAADTSGPPPVTGKYKLTQGGRIYIQLMNGKKYSTTISPINPNRFDLIDSETDGVTTFDRVSDVHAGEAKPALTGRASEHVQDVGGALFVFPAVGTAGLDEAVAQVEALGAGVGLECPQLGPVGALALGDVEQAAADAAAGALRVDVELIDVVAVEYQDPGELAGWLLGDPQLAGGDDVRCEVAADVGVVMHERRDRGDGGLAGF